MTNIFKRIKTTSRNVKRKTVKGYHTGQRLHRKAVNSKLYKDSVKATNNVRAALDSPFTEVDTPHSRRFKRRSNEFGKIMFGDRYRR